MVAAAKHCRVAGACCAAAFSMRFHLLYHLWLGLIFASKKMITLQEKFFVHLPLQQDSLSLIYCESCLIGLLRSGRSAPHRWRAAALYDFAVCAASFLYVGLAPSLLGADSVDACERHYVLPESHITSIPYQ